jgi:hypothetical protein
MAGLLDIFGTSGADTMGLLGMSQADIARNREDAQAQALYALAGRLFQGGNTGQSIVEGLQRGQQAYKGGMQDTLQSQLQNVQLADMIRKRKLEQQQLAEQQRIQGVIQGAVTKPQEIYGEDMMGQRVGEGMTAGGFDLQRAMPQLMGSAEGRKALSELVAATKAMGGETTSLAEGASLIRTNPITGKVETVVQGKPKDNLTSNYKDFQQAVNEGYTGNFMQYQKDLKSAGATKVALDIGESTAVAKQKLATLNQWQGTLKDTGDTVVAGRASAFYDAYGKAKTGNTSADGALIYNIAKVYDQTGAVQQGDVNTIIGNRSIPTNIQLFAQKLLKGGTFTPKERDDLKSIVDGIVEERQKSLAPTINVYRGLNSALGGKPEEIINPYDTVRQSGGATDLASQAKAELARRKKEVNK